MTSTPTACQHYMGFNLGNAMKYIWRADLKNGVEDLEKAIWCLKDEAFPWRGVIARETLAKHKGGGGQ